jgi:hypothetical protein
MEKPVSSIIAPVTVSIDPVPVTVSIDPVMPYALPIPSPDHEVEVDGAAPNASAQAC